MFDVKNVRSSAWCKSEFSLRKKSVQEIRYLFYATAALVGFPNFLNDFRLGFVSAFNDSITWYILTLISQIC